MKSSCRATLPAYLKFAMHAMAAHNETRAVQLEKVGAVWGDRGVIVRALLPNVMLTGAGATSSGSVVRTMAPSADTSA
jgi:hypothetical protein